MRYYVYCYWHPDGTPIYIGKGSGDRVDSHLQKSNRRHGPFHREVEALIAAGTPPTPEIIIDGLSEDEAFQWEVHLITFIGRVHYGNGPLLNSTDGGDGYQNGYVADAETARRVSLENWENPDYVAKTNAARKANPRGPSRKTKIKRFGEWIDRVVRELNHGIRLTPTGWRVNVGTTYVCTRRTWLEALEARAAAVAGEDVSQTVRIEGWMKEFAADRRREKLAQKLIVEEAARVEELARRAAERRSKIRARIIWRPIEKNWQIKFQNIGRGSRAKYCDALTLKIEIEREFHHGVPRVVRRRGRPAKTS